ncbi:hypothetical protein ASG76_02235 [Nocardioides sp. Soil774]|nr:hypothetical protein ASG76_02235 [Nocardioides sp. Soil774]
MEILNRALEPHRDSMRRIQLQIDGTALADLSRTAERVRANLAPNLTVLTAETNRILQDFRENQTTILKDLGPLIDASAAARMLETVDTAPTVTGAESAARTDPAGTDLGGRFTAQQLLAAATLLAGLHSYLMDLRDADLADAGTLLIVLAALVAIYALLSDTE